MNAPTADRYNRVMGTARTTWVLALALFVGCTPTGSLVDGGDLDAAALDAHVDAGPPVSPPELDAFLDDYGAELCRLALTCVPRLRSSGYLAEAWCHPGWMDEHTRAWVDFVRRGHARFDDARGRACIAVLRSMDACLDGSDPREHNRDLRPLAPCWSPFVGTTGEGQECDPYYGDACGEGLWCERANTCPTSCRRRAGVGAPCGTSQWCDEGLRCEGGTCAEVGSEPCYSDEDCYEPGEALRLCLDRQCASTPTLVDGDPCAGLHEWCPPGLFCDSDPTDPRCRTLGERDDPCRGSDECAAGLACLNDGAAYRCTDPLPAGASCTSDDCAPEAPFCVREPDFAWRCSADAEGASCRAWAQPVIPTWSDECPDGYACVPETDPRWVGGTGPHSWPGLCRREVALGDACDDNTPCALGARCDGGICHRVAAPGEACGDVDHCPLSHSCLEGVCAPRPVLGEACDSSRRCFVGACVAGRCAPREVGGDCADEWSLSFGVCEVVCDRNRGVCELGVSEGGSCNLRPCAPGLDCRYMGVGLGVRCQAGCTP